MIIGERWSIKTLIYLFGIYFLFWVFWGFIDWYSDSVLTELETLFGFFFFEELIDSLIIIFLVLYVFRKWALKLEDVGFSTTLLFKNILLGIGLGIVLGISSTYVDGFMVSKLGEGPIEHYLFKEVENVKNFLHLFLLAIIACIFVPFSEELLFRGLVYNIFKNKLKKFPSAMLITALIFALLHINPIWFPSLIILSLGVTLLYEYTGSLIGPIVAHSVINGIVFIVKWKY